MFQQDWLILRILHQSFEIERPKGHWSEVVVHLYHLSKHLVICIFLWENNLGIIQEANLYYVTDFVSMICTVVNWVHTICSND